MDEHPDIIAADESTHTTSRRSARSARVEIITRGERRRRWTPEQKRDIVAESYGADLTPTEVARKHGISSGQLYTWRQEVLGVGSAASSRGRLPPRRTRRAHRHGPVMIDNPAAAMELLDQLQTVLPVPTR